MLMPKNATIAATNITSSMDIPLNCGARLRGRVTLWMKKRRRPTACGGQRTPHCGGALENVPDYEYPEPARDRPKWKRCLPQLIPA